MEMGQLDVTIRLGAISIILLLALLLFRERRAVGMPALLFLPLAICLSGFVAGNTPFEALRLAGAAGAVAHVASGFAVVFLWWFCLSCFESGFRLHGGVLAVGLAWAAIAAADRGLFGPALADIGLSNLLLVIGFGIVGHLVWRLAAERGGDLIQRRHDARMIVAVLLGGELLFDLLADLLFGFDWRPLPFTLLQNGAILFLGVWLATQLLAVRGEVLTFRTAASDRRDDVADDAPHDALRRRLSVLIEEKRVYLDPALTFDGFVAAMAASERSVRRLINHELGFDHFRSFLNHQRMAEARRRLSDPRHSGDKLITVALDSGFASLASFNRVFSTVEGCSPSQFRAMAGGESPAPPGSEERKAGF